MSPDQLHVIASDQRLTDAEVAELDTYSELRGIQLLVGTLPARAAELWEREILYGCITAPPGEFDGLVRRALGNE